MRNISKIFPALICLLFAAIPCYGQTTRPVQFAPAVWTQPASKFAYWKAAGIQTILGCPTLDGTMASDGMTFAQWCDAADAAGLTYWLPYNKAAAPLLGRKGCLGAILQPDEPNGAGWKSPGWCLDEYHAIKQVTAKPVLLNLDGSALRYANAQYQTDAEVVSYGAACDVLAFDHYPINRGQGAATIPEIGLVASRLAKLCPGKPILAAIECSNQLLTLSDWLTSPGMELQGTNARGPTAGEVRLEVSTAIQAGVAGVFYFPDQIGKGWISFDGTPADVLAAMKAINATMIPPPVVAPAPDPIDGLTIQINGKTYTITAKH